MYELSFIYLFFKVSSASFQNNVHATSIKQIENKIIIKKPYCVYNFAALLKSSYGIYFNVLNVFMSLQTTHYHTFNMKCSI